MAVVLMLGAGPLAAFMAAGRSNSGLSRASSYARPGPSPSLYAPTGEGQSSARNAASLAASTAGARVSHSQTTSADQPADDKVANEAASRATLRAIFARQ